MKSTLGPSSPRNSPWNDTVFLYTHSEHTVDVDDSHMMTGITVALAVISESALFAKCVQMHKEFVVVFKKLLVNTRIHTYIHTYLT